MKRIGRPILAAGLAVALSAPAQAADFVSRYTQVNDRKACRYTESKASNDDPASCEYSCAGPVAGVRTRLLSCSDYEHLFVQLDGGSYSTWGPMVAVGAFSGLANKTGMVEWAFSPGGRPSRDNLEGLIVRFQGTDSETGKNRNALAVISLRAGQICWKGNFATNEAARAALATDGCKEELKPEKP
jgi:hypothetical protein